MEKYLEILQKCPLFLGIDKNDLLRMLVCLDAKVEFFDKKYTIFAEGKPAKYVGIVLSGSVQMVANDYYGNRSIISTAEASELIGETFACADVESIPISIVADEPCEIMFIECRRILHSCSNVCTFHFSMIFNLMKNLARKNITFHEKIEITSKRSTREKLMTYLSLRARAVGTAYFDIPFDRQELADYLEVERTGLSAEISKLKKEGIIDCSKNHFKIRI